MFLYNTELFPTKVRGFTSGFTTLGSRQMCALIPFIFRFCEKFNLHPFTIFIPVASMALIGSLFLPETKNRKLLL